TYRSLAVPTYRNLGLLNPIFQAELQRLVTAQFPESSNRIPPPACRLHTTLQGYFLKIDADAHHHCALACLACWTPRRFLYDQLDGFEPPLTGGVVAVACTHELLTILGQQLFRAFLDGLQGHLDAHAPNLHGPGNPIATDGAKPWIHGMRSRRVMLGR